MDSGARGAVAVEDLLELPHSAEADPLSPAHWPALAIRCRLSDATPASGGR